MSAICCLDTGRCWSFDFIRDSRRRSSRYHRGHNRDFLVSSTSPRAQCRETHGKKIRWLVIPDQALWIFAEHFKVVIIPSSPTHIGSWSSWRLFEVKIRSGDGDKDGDNDGVGYT